MAAGVRFRVHLGRARGRPGAVRAMFLYGNQRIGKRGTVIKTDISAEAGPLLQTHIHSRCIVRADTHRGHGRGKHLRLLRRGMLQLALREGCEWG